MMLVFQYTSVDVIIKFFFFVVNHLLVISI